MRKPYEHGLDAHYEFVHSSGRRIIAQTYLEFVHMQGHHDKSTIAKVPAFMKTGANGSFDKRYWSSYERRGYREYRGFPSKEQHEAENRMNRIWEAAKGYERLFPTDLSSSHPICRLHTGYYGCGMRRFLAEVANHANMVGDRETWDKAEDMQSLFTGNQILLPYKIAS
jgi:hypothetical protein